MFCGKCGNQLPEGTKFCPNCGEPLSQTANEQRQIVINNTVNSQKGSALSICSMVCGILSIALCCISCIGVILGILAIVFGVIALLTGAGGRGMAITGIVTGIIGSGLIIVMMAGGFSITEYLQYM